MEKTSKIKIKKTITRAATLLVVILVSFSLNKVSAETIIISDVSDTAMYTTAEITGKYTTPADGVLPEGFIHAVYSTDPTFPGGGTSTGLGTLETLATGHFFTINVGDIAPLSPGTKYFYKVQDFGTTYASGDFTTLNTDISIGDTVAVADGGDGYIYINGTYNKSPATDPAETNFLYAVYGPTDGEFGSSTGISTLSAIAGYDMSTHGNFTIIVPVAGLTAGTTYYFNLRDNAKTYYSVDPETGKTPFFKVDPTFIPTLSESTIPSSVSCDGPDGYCLLAPLPGLEKITPDIDFGKYVNLVLGLIIGISGAIAVVMITIAGIQYMASDVITSKSEARKMINNSFAGLGLLLSAFILLKTINPNLVNFKFELKKANYQLEGDTYGAGIGTISITGAYIPSGISCTGTGGAAAVKSIAESFIGKTTYNQALRLTSGPSGTIYLDCSSYVNYIKACAGLPQVGERTAIMFTAANKTVTSLTGTTVNGNPLNVGDVLGWKDGECTSASGGHVLTYIGGGQVIDTHGPTYPDNNGPVGGATDKWDLDTYSHKSCLVHYIPV